MPEQKKSVLLTQEENDIIFELLGYKCQTLSTTVIELYTTNGVSSGEWFHQDTGVLCFVKDHSKRSYFFRLYCPVRKTILWEQEIYNNIQYCTPTSFLHTFEAEDCIAGFNFASEDEGKYLHKVVTETLEFKNQKRVERRNRCNSNAQRAPYGVNGNANLIKNNNISSRPSAKPVGKSGRKKVSKADIGEPQDFRHVSHVGWDPYKGFEWEKDVDPRIRAFLTQAGVSESHLEDKDTREFIYDFISKNGGIEAVEEQMDPPPVPQRIKAAPPRPPVRILPPPPPPPQRVQPPRIIPGDLNYLARKPNEADDEIHVNTNFYNKRIPDKKIDSRGVSKQIETAKVDHAGPPPPPPPPPPGPPPPPMMNLPEVTPPFNIPPNPRDALMEEILNRKQLKPLNVDPKETEDKRLPAAMATDSHFQLMDQIKEGIKLKPVTAPSNSAEPVPLGGLASALAKALAERNKVICDSSDSSSGTDTDEADDEWD